MAAAYSTKLSALFASGRRHRKQLARRGLDRRTLGHRIHIVSPLNGPGLLRAIVTIVVLGAGLPKPCLGQRPATTPAFDAWSSLEVRQPTDRPVLSFLPKRETYKSLGLWIGFGLGALAVPFVWSACERGSGSCPASEKTFIAGALTAGGAFLGLLVGRQFKKKEKPLQNDIPLDSSRVPQD